MHSVGTLAKSRIAVIGSTIDPSFPVDLSDKHSVVVGEQWGTHWDPQDPGTIDILGIIRWVYPDTDYEPVGESLWHLQASFKWRGLGEYDYVETNGQRLKSGLITSNDALTLVQTNNFEWREYDYYLGSTASVDAWFRGPPEIEIPVGTSHTPPDDTWMWVTFTLSVVGHFRKRLPRAQTSGHSAVTHGYSDTELHERNDFAGSLEFMGTEGFEVVHSRLRASSV